MAFPSSFRGLRVLFPACVLAAAACGGGAAIGSSEGPYLSPGPLPIARSGTVGATPAVPAAVSPPRAPVADQGAAASPIPAGLTGNQGTARLPGAAMPGIGPVHGLVVPVSLGPRLPVRDDAALGRQLFGPGGGGAAPTLVEQMRAASAGLFRASFDVLPTLVDSRRGVLGASPTPAQLLQFAEAVLRSAGSHTDFARYDNDGPDGIPHSRDDDGRVDYLLLVVETDEEFASVTLRQGITLATAAGPIETGPLHILCLGRSEGLDPRPGLGLWLDALGLDPIERFFPPDFARGISSLARVRLGWLPVEAVSVAGHREIADGRALLFPLLDLAPGMGFWLVERDGSRVYVSRIARREDGHFVATESLMLAASERKVLALTRQFGDRGARVELSWSASGPVAEVVVGGTGAAAR